MDPPRSSPTERRDTLLRDLLTVLPQYVTPQRLLSSLMHRFATVRWAPFKDAQIRWITRRYNIDLGEAVEPDARRYPHLNALFTRALRPGARPLPEFAEDIVSPADGVVSAMGHAAGATALQAKGRHYTLGELLGAEADATPYLGGSYLTVYLSPRDYHRVHMPTAGTLRRLRYIPGRLFSVNASTSRLVPRLFARNERVVTHFETDVGQMAVVLVGALLVGGIETVWTGPITPPHGQPAFLRNYPDGALHLRRGEELGRFNMGSTVIVLLEPGRIEWLTGTDVGARLRVGTAVGRCSDPERSAAQR